MLRRIGYRQAAVAFVFTSLWFVLGFLLIWSPVPGALGIHATLLALWILFFFGLLALSGAVLIAASINATFPPASRRRARAGAQPQPAPAGRAPHAGRANPQQGR